MKRIFQWARVALVLIVTLALLTWLIAVVRTAMQPSVRLPDDSILRVVKVEYGESHEFHRGSETLSKAVEFVSDHLPFYYDLPDAMRRTFQGMGSYVSTGSSFGADTLGVWIWREREATGALELQGAELLDDAKGKRVSFSDFQNVGTNGLPGHLSFSVLPRRQRTLTIRILAGNETRLLTIKNPLAGRKYPTWQPSPLPHSERVADIVMTMTGWESFRDGTTANNLNYYPRLDVQVNGELRDDWFRWWASMEDATGNSGTQLPLSESAWKVSATLVRSAGHPLVLAHSDTLTDIPIPGPGKLVEIPLTDALRKRGFVYAAVHGRGEFWLVDGHCVASGTLENQVPEPTALPRVWSCHSVFGPSLLMVASPESAAAGNITWRLEDQQGRRIGDDYCTSENRDPGYMVWKEQFHPFPNSQTFNVVVGDPGKEYSVEFMAPPPR
jgi:hypothetical protein